MCPKLLEIGPFTLHTYGVMLALALLASIYTAAWLGKKEGISPKYVWDFGFVVIISAIIGSKVLLVITSADYYLQDLSRLFSIDFLRAGGVFYGGLLGAIVGCYIFSRLNPSVSFFRMSDIAAPAIPLGQAIGRLGCFSAGCCWGSHSELPWAVTFTNSYSHNLIGVPLHEPLHPIQLYESLVWLILFFVLLTALKKKFFRVPGQLLCVYLVSFGIIRFLLEYLRGDLERGIYFNGLLSTSQLISLLVVPAAAACFLALGRKRRA